MAVKLRMQRRGSKKRPFYFIVAANNTAPRDGKFIEKLGTYNPLTVPASIELDRDRALDWLQKGAQPTHTVRRILSFKGVLYKKHLVRGISLGLFDEAAATEKFEKWIIDHEELVAKKGTEHKKAKQEKRQSISQEAVKHVEEKQAAVRKKIEEAEAAQKAEEEAKVAEEAGETAENEAGNEPTAETPKEPKAETPKEPKAETPKEPKAETPEEPKASTEDKAEDSEEAN